MVNRFLDDKWKDKEKQPSIKSKITNIGKPSQDIKQKITLVTNRIDIQTQTLNRSIKLFENRDAALFKCVVKAISDRDKARANIYASELGKYAKSRKC